MMKLASVALTLLSTVSLFVPAAAQFCITDIQEIYTQEALVTDTSRRRTYVLCTRRIFQIGTLDFDMNLDGVGVQPPLPIRPNMTIQCGDTGSRDDQCWITGGDLQVDATPYRGIDDASVEGAVVKGLVFVGATRYSVWAAKMGAMMFYDCEWRGHTKSVVPVLLDYFDGTESLLTVTFDQCDFKENTYLGLGSHTALIYANGQQNALSIMNTAFENNDITFNNTMVTSSSFLIETLGPLSIHNSCFENNAVGVSNVVVFGSTFEDSNNYVYNSTGEVCSFSSVFQTLQQFDNFAPICVNAMGSTCLAGITEAPTTAAPTVTASMSPSLAPSPSPSGIPTMAPTGGPSVSASPTNSTESPTAGPTESPTMAPSPPPTEKPSATAAPVSFAFPTNPPEDGAMSMAGSMLAVVLGVVGTLLFA